MRGVWVGCVRGGLVRVGWVSVGCVREVSGESVRGGLDGLCEGGVVV